MRIAFCGAAGTGKSTLTEKLLEMDEFRDHKRYENIQRTLHSNLHKFPHSSFTNDISQVTITAFISYQIIKEPNIICDRSLIDTFAYAKLAEKVTMLGEIEETFSEVLKMYDLIIYTPIEFTVPSDSFRDTNMDYIRETDEAIVYYLEKYNVNYLEVRGSVEERMEIIENKLKEIKNGTH